MRAVNPLYTAVSAALLLAACDATGPGPSSESELLVLTVVPSQATIDGGAFVQLTANVKGEDGPVAKPVGVHWSSADISIARVGDDGLVEGKRAGLVRIDATWEGSTGAAWVQVRRALKPGPDTPACLKRLPVPLASSSIPDTGC
jgi:hypothetical protein